MSAERKKKPFRCPCMRVNLPNCTTRWKVSRNLLAICISLFCCWSRTAPAEFPIKLHSLRCQSRSIFSYTCGVVLHTATRLIHVPWFFFLVHFSFRGPKLVPGWFTVGWPGWFVLFAWKKFYKPNAGKKEVLARTRWQFLSLFFDLESRQELKGLRFVNVCVCNAHWCWN